MPAETILGGLSQEATLQDLLGTTCLLLAAILDKLPRTTGNDQAAVSVEGTATVAIAGGQTLGTVTTVGTVTTLTTVGTVTNAAQLGGRPAQAAADSLSNAGVLHIYDRITLS